MKWISLTEKLGEPCFLFVWLVFQFFVCYSFFFNLGFVCISWSHISYTYMQNINMLIDHVSMQHYHVDMHHIYVSMRLIYADMHCNYDGLQPYISHYILSQHQHAWESYVLFTSHIGPWDHHLTNGEQSSNEYGARTVQTLGAQLWNELPLKLRRFVEHGAFRKNLKTLLFKREYALWI